MQFAEFMADPFATIRAIYDRLGLELTADAERACATSSPPTRRTSTASTTYTFADTGLDEGELREHAGRTRSTSTCRANHCRNGAGSAQRRVAARASATRSQQ